MHCGGIGRYTHDVSFGGHWTRLHLILTEIEELPLPYDVYKLRHRVEGFEKDFVAGNLKGYEYEVINRVLGDILPKKPQQSPEPKEDHWWAQVNSLG